MGSAGSFESTQTPTKKNRGEVPDAVGRKTWYWRENGSLDVGTQTYHV